MRGNLRKGDARGGGKVVAVEIGCFWAAEVEAHAPGHHAGHVRRRGGDGVWRAGGC